jgi:CHAD domain-containing protein
LRMQIDGTTPLWVAARVLLYERGDDFCARLDKGLKTSDAEEIHDLRVASRRLREGLALFAPCYPVGSIARLVGQLKKVTTLLGEIRNADEAVLFFTALADELDAEQQEDLQRISDSYQKRRKKELKKLRSGLKEIESAALCEMIRRVINSPSLFTLQEKDIDLFVPLSHFAGEAMVSRLAAVSRILPEAKDAGEIEAQHMLRIAVKHFRYRMEILSFLFGESYEKMHETLKDYQDLLGNMHDLDVFAGIIRNAGLTLLTQKPLLDTIAAKRRKLFVKFSVMLETTPFERIGEQMRTIL